VKKIRCTRAILISQSLQFQQTEDSSILRIGRIEFPVVIFLGIDYVMFLGPNPATAIKMIANSRDLQTEFHS
jgi:hypothetical protein